MKKLLIGIVGKSNIGKTTLFNAMTQAGGQIGPYPFTTIDPNKGIAFVSSPCPHTELGVQCKPRNSKCENGVRKIPVNVVDVAGLVPDAHKGRGLGIQFLSDISAADALICVVDAAGATDDEGKPAPIGSHDPARDVEILVEELEHWIAEVIKRNAVKAKGKSLNELAQYLSGIKVGENTLKNAIAATGVSEDFPKWSEEDFLKLARELRKKTKPMIIAANKIDLPNAEENIKKLKEKFTEIPVVPISADSELALKKACEKKWIKYDEKEFEVTQENLPEAINQALKKIKENVLNKYGSTGVQELLRKLIFEVLDMIVVYPVEDEKHYADHFGNTLPDAILLPKGATAIQLAECIHTDLAKGFLYAIDCRKGMRVGREQILKNNDVIKIVSTR